MVRRSYFCTMEKTIPLLDAARFVSGTQEDRIGFAQDLRQAFERYGFITLENHGLDQSADRPNVCRSRAVLRPSGGQKSGKPASPVWAATLDIRRSAVSMPRTRPGPISRNSTTSPRPTTTNRIALTYPISWPLERNSTAGWKPSQVTCSKPWPCRSTSRMATSLSTSKVETASFGCCITLQHLTHLPMRQGPEAMKTSI